MKYSVSAETSRRIYKNWIVEAESKEEAFEQFKAATGTGLKRRLTRVHIEECEVTLNMFRKI